MKVAIIGAFAKGKNLLNGQTIKTKIIADEIEKELGKGVWRIDTFGFCNNVVSLILCAIAIVIYKNIIILPAQNALKVLAPWIRFWNTLFRRRLHYVVIGGWLPEYIDHSMITAKNLYGFDYIYVETQTMMRALIERGYKNVQVLPNCKDLKIMKEEELTLSYEEPYRLVTFSRVMKQKGIEDAVRVVREINREMGRTVFELDIFGQVDDNESEWFEKMSLMYRLNENDSSIRYKGCAPFEESVEILSSYFALLFPTRFYTEGIPGTIIDAYAAGVPVISARWESFADVIDDGVTGIGFGFEEWDELKKVLYSILDNPTLITNKKRSCLRKAIDYIPSSVVPNIRLNR